MPPAAWPMFTRYAREAAIQPLQPDDGVRQVQDGALLPLHNLGGVPRLAAGGELNPSRPFRPVTTSPFIPAFEDRRPRAAGRPRP